MQMIQSSYNVLKVSIDRCWQNRYAVRYRNDRPRSCQFCFQLFKRHIVSRVLQKLFIRVPCIQISSNILEQNYIDYANKLVNSDYHVYALKPSNLLKRKLEMNFFFYCNSDPDCNWHIAPIFHDIWNLNLNLKLKSFYNNPFVTTLFLLWNF